MATTRTQVPAREGRVVLVRPGDRIRVVDLAGAQVGDVFAFVLDERERLTGEHLSASHTRVATQRLFPAVGQAFATDRRRPVLTLETDDSPGHHDLLAAACDEQRYLDLGAPPGHPSCADNVRQALASIGAATAVVPQPVNVFMHVPVNADGSLEWLPATTQPGDSITFRAELPCAVVLSACPQELTGINGGNPTDLALDVMETRR